VKRINNFDSKLITLKETFKGKQQGNARTTINETKFGFNDKILIQWDLPKLKLDYQRLGAFTIV
jgi:hypothetical protein